MRSSPVVSGDRAAAERYLDGLGWTRIDEDTWRCPVCTFRARTRPPSK